MNSPTTNPDPATTRKERAQTEIGSVFVSNYPPYSFWKEEEVGHAYDVLNSSPADSETPLGLYIHIPFCRKRCRFCYFRVYTDKNSSDIQQYLDGLILELEIYAELPAVQGRDLTFIYFGGGTPSYISARHLRQFVARAQQCISWKGAREVAFECEPGTLTQAKLEAIKEIGVTRLSLGIENLNDEILASNGRAHRSPEIYQVMPWIRELEFEQLNVDLIAGMVGESWDSWKETVSRTIALEPDSVTIYQMELPHNTVYSKELAQGSDLDFANWETKRAWHAYAMEQFEEAGFEASSAYTMTRAGGNGEFVYRDAVWQSSDMLGTGVASFSHVGGVHFQNLAEWDPYLTALQEGRLPLARGFVTDAAERLTREFILQLKVGRLSPSYFQEKFGVDIVTRFLPVLQDLEREQLLYFNHDLIELTRKGLLQVDQLLPEFYDLKYRNARYT